ncbi:MAG: ComEC/Rec2 family competence protein [Acidobacteriota bacterium]
MRDPLLAPFAALAGGLLAARFVPFGTGELLCPAAVLALLAAVAAFQGRRRAALVSFLGALSLAGALAGVAHRGRPVPQLDAGARELVIVEGCVVEPAVFSEDRAQFTLELDPGARARVSLYARPGETLPDLRYGQRIEMEARVRRTHNFRNPGSFDYAAYLARQDIYWNASGRASSVRVLAGRCGSRFRQALFDLRSAALGRIANLYGGDSYNAGMMQAILIGENANLEKIWTEDFRRTGTYHALVISGLHVTVLAGFLLFLLRICFVPEPPALAATTLAAWLYALVSGWTAPVVRSAAGFTLFVAARYFYRRPRLLNILALIAGVLVAFDPEQMFDASFQLSFLSVAAIAALAVPVIDRTSAPLARGLRGLSDIGRDPRLDPRAAHFRVEVRLVAQTLALWTRIPERACLGALGLGLRAFFYAYELVVVSAIVQFGLALPMAIYFHRLSITGLTANLFVVPLMSAVVPVGFIAIFTGWKFMAVAAGWLLAAAGWVARLHVRWEPEWRIPNPPVWLALAFAASLMLLAFRLSSLKRLCVLCVSAVALLLLIWHPFAGKVAPGVFEATAIDVGQSESLFLAFPDGKLMLLDGGGFPSMGARPKPRLDIGEDVVSPYLWTRSIRRLDTIVLSHPHEDHIGGLAAVVANFRPKELWTGAVADCPEWRRLRAEAARCGVRIVAMEAGRRFRYGGAGIEVLAPEPGHEPSAKAPNNDSLVLRMSYGRHAFLFTGDIERRVESELVQAGLAHADVLKVPHHGSRTSSTEPFLEAVRPAFGLISAGFENSFGNPHPAVVSRYEDRQATLLRTDACGLVSVISDGKRIRFESGCYTGL